MTDKPTDPNAAANAAFLRGWHACMMHATCQVNGTLDGGTFDDRPMTNKRLAQDSWRRTLARLRRVAGSETDND